MYRAPHSYLLGRGREGLKVWMVREVDLEGEAECDFVGQCVCVVLVSARVPLGTVPEGADRG